MENEQRDLKRILDAIIRERSDKAEKKVNQEKALESQREKLLRLQEAYQKFSMLDGDEQGQVCGGSGKAEELLRSEQTANDCLRACEEAIDAAAALRVRFQRPTIDITVIGKIGTGKSKFLQSASGLDDSCIPSLKGASCTGVSSVIENLDAPDITEAHFTFKTEQEVLKDIGDEIANFARRLHELMPDVPVADVRGIGDLEPGSIRLGFQGLKAKAEEVLKMCQPNSKTGTMVETLQAEIRDKEQEYAGEKERAEWLPYVGSQEKMREEIRARGLEPRRGQDGKYYYVLSEPAKIKLFVSKHQGDGGQKYYSYIAVKGAVIRTHIEGIDARIRLVDTVGIGDRSADTAQRIQEAVSRESDGVIFIFSKPGGRIVTDAGPDDEDMDLLQKLREIFLEHEKMDARHWMAFLLNHREDSKDPGNRGFSEKYMRIIEDRYNGPDDVFGSHGILYRKVVDVSSPSEVKVMLKEFLQQIADNLDSVDRRMEEDFQRKERFYRAQEVRLRSQLGRLRVISPKLQTQNSIYLAVNQCLDSLRTELKKYRKRLLEEIDTGCVVSFMKQRLEMVSRLRDGEKVDGLGTDLDSIISTACEEEVYLADARLSAFKSLKAALRKIAALPAEAQTQTEEEYKRTIAEIFIRCLRLRVDGLKGEDGTPLCESSPKFFGIVGSCLFSWVMDSGELLEIFDSLDRFGLDEMNALTEALFYHYAELCLTDHPYGDETHGSDEPEEDDLQAVWNASGKSADDGFERDRMRREFQGKLDIFIQNVEEAAGSETYLVKYTDQMNEELCNFMRILGWEFRERWHMAFEGLREKGLLEEKGTDIHRQEFMGQVSQKMDTCLADFL